MNANKMPMKRTENILVFYDSMPKYNPQFVKLEPYSKKKSNPRFSSTYGKYFSKDYQRDLVCKDTLHPHNVLFFPVVHFPEHPTQKPIDLCEYLIKTYTDPGETVLDITAGSGTTAVAAVNLDRDWVAFEKESDYYHIVARRIGDAMDQKERSLFFTGFPEQKFQLEA